MSTVPARSPARTPARTPARGPAPQRRPHRPAKLKVLPGGPEAARQHARRQAGTRGATHASRGTAHLKFFIVSAAVVAALVFALVLLNIMVVQRSFELGDLQTRVAEAQAEHRKMRFEVAQAEAPARVAESAAQLGLTVPERQEYLLGNSSTSGPPAGLAASGRDGSTDLREVEGRLKAVQGP